MGARPLFFRHATTCRQISRPASRPPSRRSRCCSSSPPGDGLRVVIDHPEGVSLALCERVTHALGDVRERYALEVSSPGPRASADQARALPALHRPARPRAHRGRRRARRAHARHRRARGGDAQEVTLAAAEGVVAIPYAAIQRSHLVEE